MAPAWPGGSCTQLGAGLNTYSVMPPRVSLSVLFCGRLKVTFTLHGRHAKFASMTVELSLPTHIQVTSQTQPRIEAQT